MTFYQLECFIAAAQEESFVGAAKKLITTQPVITYQIGTLEKELGCQLFDRSKRRVSLSPAGAVFLEDALALVADCRSAVERVRAVDRREHSRLRIGIRRFSNYGDVSEMIRQLSEVLPGVQADMIVQSSFEPLQNLRTGDTHISYLFDAECEGCEDIAFEPLYPMYRYMLMRDDHPLAKRESAPLEAFCGEKLLKVSDEELHMAVVGTSFAHRNPAHNARMLRLFPKMCPQTCRLEFLCGEYRMQRTFSCISNTNLISDRISCNCSESIGPFFYCKINFQWRNFCNQTCCFA